MSTAKATRQRKPYSKSSARRKPIAMPTAMDEVLNLDTDTEYGFLKSDSDSNQATTVSVLTSKNTPIVQLANDEMMVLLKEIRNSQSALCTKTDLHDYSNSITKKFGEVDQRVSSNTSAINSFASRLSKIESSLASSKYETEINKQHAIARNLSIMGIPPTDNEDLVSIAMSLFALVGCALARADIFGSYRVKNANSSSNIVVVKLNDLSIKHRILKSKFGKELKLKDVIQCNPRNNNQVIYINNHVTPFFGKLLSEGRKAVKEKIIHSVWLSKDGCRLRFVADGEERGYRSVGALHDLTNSVRNSSDNRRSVNQNKRSRSRSGDVQVSPAQSQLAKK